MALTSAERQARYRKKTATTTVRLNLAISKTAKLALETLAKRQNLSQRETLEQVLIFTLENMEARP